MPEIQQKVFITSFGTWNKKYITHLKNNKKQNIIKISDFFLYLINFRIISYLIAGVVADDRGTEIFFGTQSDQENEMEPNGSFIEKTKQSIVRLDLFEF